MSIDPIWTPTTEQINNTHLAKWMKELNLTKLIDFHRWTVNSYEAFWQKIIEVLQIRFQHPYEKICDLSHGIETPNWLANAKMNIVDSCFNADPNKIAIIQQRKNKNTETITYGQLDKLSNRVANSLSALRFQPGDTIGLAMPTTIETVAIYLGIIKLGCIVVSIPDSFSQDEIAIRLRIAKTKAVFTQDVILRDQKKLPLYEKVIGANAAFVMVVPADSKLHCTLRKHDLQWQHFLNDNDDPISHACHPMSNCNILFSSGTTGEPKAIPWNHTTLIKVASDAYFHHDIKSKDILAWPTNLGWMMGPWLLFASFIHQATMALYDGIPRDRELGQFVQDAKVTMLGVVPTLVSYYKQTHCMEEFDWSSIERFSSTGECSNPEDMTYLSQLAGGKPIIEYCGGTEIGGAYLSSTLIEPNYPSCFTTPTMGMNIMIIDDEGNPTRTGEVAIIPPSIGLSTELLNSSHYDVYYAGMPTLSNGAPLRRHGDAIHQLDDHLYMVLGRVDDTMNLSGIKVSSAEIERAIVGIDSIRETAAIAITPNGGGPSQLVIYAATDSELEKESIQKIMQQKISLMLNPLFKIHDVIFLTDLPKTASNKIMRRVLRKQYEKKVHP